MKPGYKQTEVGVIPKDWEVASLSSVSGERMQNGLFFKPSLKGSGVKLINVGDLYASVPIDSDALELFDATDKERERFKVEDGDLLFTRSSVVPSGIAHCNIYRSPKPESVVFDSHVIRLRPDIEKVASSFLFRFCVASVARRYLVSHAKTATMTTIDQGVLGKCPVILPPLAEQEAIAEALGDADALIESLEQLLVKKRDLKQGAMQELLTGKRSLLGFSGKWEVKRLGDVADTDPENLGSDTRPHFTFNYIALEDVDVGTLRSYSEQVFCTAPSRARRRLRKGDILVSTVRPSLMSHMLFNADGDNWVCSTGFCVVRCREGVSYPGYLYFHMFAERVARQIEALLTGSNYPAINGGDVRALQIPIPEYKEQTAIAAILSDMDAEIAALEAKLAKTRQLKQGMMQELLTGRIRLV